MAILVPSARYPILPPVEGLQVEDPVDTDEAIGLGDVEGHLLYFRRRACHRTIQHDTPSGYILWEDPRSVNAAHAPIIWRTSEVDRYVQVFLWYQASPESSGGVVQINATLSTVAGAVLDGSPGVRWQHLDGSLPVGVGDLYHVPGTGSLVQEWPVLRVDTGLTIDDAPAATPTPPRLLNLTSAGAGAKVRLDLTTQACRILAVDVWTLFEPRVEL